MTKPCLIVGGVGLKKGRIRNGQQAMIRLAKEINPYLIEEGFLNGAPFGLMNVIFRYGTEANANPACEAINETRKELPFAVEVDMDALRNEPTEVVWQAFAKVLVGALFVISSIYRLNPRGI